MQDVHLGQWFVLIHECMGALRGSNNIQELLFSCAGGRCWEILQSMQVVGKRKQRNVTGRRAEDNVKQFSYTRRLLQFAPTHRVKLDKPK